MTSTTHVKQMKLSNAIAPSVVLGLSILTASCTSTTINNLPQQPLAEEATSSTKLTSEQMEEIRREMRRDLVKPVDYETKVRLDMEAEYARSVNRALDQVQKNSAAQQEQITRIMMQ